MIEQMITRAVLSDHFSPVLRKIAHEQDAYARKTMALNTAGNLFLGAGTAAGAFLTKSVKIAGRMDEIQKSMAAVQGPTQALQNMEYIDKFAAHSKFTLLDLASAGERLSLQNVNVAETLGDIADVAAASGKPLGQISQLYDALLAGGRVGLALSARGGFAQYGISAKEIFAAAGKPYSPGQNLQNAMTPAEVQAAVHKVLTETGRSGLNEKLARTTLSGALGMLEDNTNRFEVAIGKADLPKTINLLNNTAEAIGHLSEEIKDVPGLGDKIALGAGGLIAAGAIAKGAVAWRDYKNYVNLAKLAGDAERKGEIDKVGIAKAEGDAVQGAAGKYGGLTAKLEGLGRAALGASGEEATLAKALTAGGLALGAYAVIAVGAAYDIKKVVDIMHEFGDASERIEKAQGANRDAKKMGYDVKQSHVTGGGKYSAWEQGTYEIFNKFSFGLMSKLTGGKFDEPTGFTALTDAQTRAAAKAHGMPKGGVRAQQIAAAKAASEKAADARREEAGQAANRFEIDPALDYKLKQDERRVALLEAQKAGQDKINAAKKTEIADLEKASALLRAQAKIATDPKAKYKLLDEADEDAQKAKLLRLDKKAGKDKGGFDNVIAQILGGGGLTGEEIIKRTGVGLKFFGSLGGHKPPANPMKSAIAHLAKRPLLVNLHIGDKKFAEFKSELKDETLHDVLMFLMRTENGSSNRQLLHTN